MLVLKFDSIFFTNSDKSGDIHSFCNNLVAKLLNENKVKLINKEVTDLRKELKEYDKIKEEGENYAGTGMNILELSHR